MQFADDAQILAAVTRVLEHVVAPALPAGDAKGQLWAAIGLLDNLAAGGPAADGAADTFEALSARADADVEQLRPLRYYRAVRGE